MTGVREREAKLGVWPGFSLPDLDDVVEGVRARPEPSRTLEATYHDTPDLRLARWGVTLRYRSGDERPWTVKLPDQGGGNGVLARRELSFAGKPNAVPPAALDLLRAYVRSATVGPVARLATRREVVALSDVGGRRLAEVVDDEVSVLDGRRVAARFREVEVEVTDDGPRGGAGPDAMPDHLLGAVVDRLRAAGAAPPDPTPKVVRALGPRALAPPQLVAVELDEGATAADVLAAAMVGSVTRVLTHDPGVRLGDDAEDVHQARVGTRRLRSDLRTFRSLVDGEWLGWARGELRWLAAELGAVRDADVLLERLRSLMVELPEGDRRAGSSLLRRLEGDRERARTRMLDALGSDRYVRLLDHLVDVAPSPPVLDEARHPAVDVLPELVRRPWRHLRKAVESLDPEPDPETLHEVRIRAKRCRYAAEAATPVMGKPARGLARAVARLQGVLGDHQDAVVAVQWLRQAAAGSATRALVAGELVTVERLEAARLRGLWRKEWKDVDRARYTGWLS